MFRTCSTLLVVWILTTGGVAAQEVDTVYVLPEVTIESSRLSLSSRDAGARMTAVTAAAISASSARQLNELLATEAAVFVRQYGAVGIGGVSLRGTGPSQISILIDGHPLASPQLGQVDLSLVPSVMLSGVQVIHGGGAALFGSSAIGGVVNLSTVGAAEQEGATVTSTVGPWGERAAAARYSARVGQIHMALAAEALHMEGDFPFTNTTRFPTAVERRQNADRDTRNVMASLTYLRDAARTRLAGWLMTGERGLPGIVGSPTPDERQWDTLQRVWLRHEMYHRRGRSLVQAAYQRSELRYRNPVVDIDQEGVTNTFSVEFSHRRELSDRVEIQGGLAGASHGSDHPGLVTRSRQNDVALFVTGGVITGPVSWYPSVRSDWILRSHTGAHAISGSLRSRTDLGPWYLKTGVERSFRAPTQNDLFWRGTGAIGNENLKPEYGTSADAGVEFVTAMTSSEVTFFFQSVRDQITWLPNSKGVWSPNNIGRVRSVGVEMSASGATNVGRRSRLEMHAKYTYTHSRDVSDTAPLSSGSTIRYVPAHVAVASIMVQYRSLFVGTSLRAVGKRYVTSDGSAWLDPYAVAAARLGGRWTVSGAFIDTTVFLDNLLGANFEVMSGYPMPPRHVRIRLAITFPDH